MCQLKKKNPDKVTHGMWSILRPKRVASYDYVYFPEKNYYLKREDAGENEINSLQLKIFSFNNRPCFKMIKHFSTIWKKVLKRVCYTTHYMGLAFIWNEKKKYY